MGFKPSAHAALSEAFGGKLVALAAALFRVTARIGGTLAMGFVAHARNREFATARAAAANQPTARRARTMRADAQEKLRKKKCPMES
jgi:hypothetical protein